MSVESASVRLLLLVGGRKGNARLRRLVRNEYTWVGAGFVLLVLIAYLVLQSVMTGNFDRLERQNVSGQAQRISTSLGYEASLVRNYVLNNSVWDDSYEAIARRSAVAATAAFPPHTRRNGSSSEPSGTPEPEGLKNA
jgi:hypothetical protein